VPGVIPASEYLAIVIDKRILFRKFKGTIVMERQHALEGFAAVGAIAEHGTIKVTKNHGMAMVAWAGKNPPARTSVSPLSLERFLNRSWLPKR
jgi:hypothetical protein